jgi:hypothetical protein
VACGKHSLLGLVLAGKEHWD